MKIMKMRKRIKRFCFTAAAITFIAFSGACASAGASTGGGAMLQDEAEMSLDLPLVIPRLTGRELAFQMAYGIRLQAADNGADGTNTGWLESAGTVRVTVIIDNSVIAPNPDAVAQTTGGQLRFLRITGRATDSSGVDIQTTASGDIQTALSPAGNYIVRVTGRALGSGNRNFKLTAVSGGAELGRVDNVSAGQVFILTSSVPLTSQAIRGSNIRIQTENGNTEDFEILNIVIIRS